jgi:hypothetical protein
MPLATSPASVTCVIIKRVAGAVKKRKWVTDMSLSQCQALLKCVLLAKLLNNPFM